jgi:hypothetical protein
MTKKNTSKKLPKQNVARIAAMDHFEVTLVRLVNCSCTLEVSKIGKPTNRYKLNFSMELAESEEAKIALVNVHCDASLMSEDGAPEDGTNVSAEFQVVFKAKNEFPVLGDDERKQLVTSGSVIAWPYLRNFIQLTVSSMGLPPFALPLFHPMQQGASIGRVREVTLMRGNKPQSKKRAKLKHD